MRLFDEQLSLLHKKMIEMSAYCETLIANLFNSDYLENKDTIDELEHDIENITYRLLLRQQPVAKDLRTLSSSLRMIRDLKRIATQGENIRELLNEVNLTSKEALKTLDYMNNVCVKMINLCINAYAQNDSQICREVCVDDDLLDDTFKNIKADLICLIQDHEIEGEEALNILMIAKYLEKIGDHVVNIAKSIIYIDKGDE